MADPRPYELLRGLAWNLPATVGGPVDLIEQAINLGLAGGGTALHKLGAISADQLPKPLEGSVGTTKWWTKGTPLEESSNPAFVRGQIAGALLPAFYAGAKQIPLQRDSTLRSIFVAPEWLPKYGIKDRDAVNRPLGRFTDDSGLENVALPRQKSAEATFSFPLLMDSLHKLGDLAPEVRGTPLADVEVRLSPNPKELSGPNVGGHADFSNKRIVMRTAEPQTGRPYDPRELLELLHHEATHFADAYRKAYSSGSWENRLDPVNLAALDGVEALKRQAPALGVASERMLTKADPHTRYLNDLGETKARVAGKTSTMISPSSATLELMYRSEKGGRELSVPVHSRVNGTEIPLPAAEFRKYGSLRVETDANGHQQVWDKATNTYIGQIRQDHAAQGENPLRRGLASGQKEMQQGRFDPRGIGGTPNNADVDYFGFTRQMPAREFLSLATKTNLDPVRIKWLMEQQQAGKPFGNPFFNVEMDKGGKAYQILDHEGRHRAQALINLFGPDVQMPVDIFPLGLRRRNLDEQMLTWPLRFQKD